MTERDFVSENSPARSYVTPAYIEDSAETILTLSNLLDVPYELRRKLTGKKAKKFDFPCEGS